MTAPPGLVVEVRQEVPLFDFRDRGAEKWLSGWLGGRNGVWRCRNVHNCTEACPRGIDVNQLIVEVKRRILEEDF